MCFVRILVAAALCLTCGLAAAQPAFDTRVTGVPEGFEELTLAQKTSVDVFYGGRFLVSTLAEFTEDSIQFLEPHEITSLIEAWVDPAAATQAVGGPLPANEHRLCGRAFEEGCGELRPAQVGVIFDISRYRADLFVAPAMLQQVMPTKPRYLPPGTSEAVSAVQNVNMVVSGDGGGDAASRRYSLFGKTRVGRNDRFGFADLVSTSDQALLVDALGYHAGFGKHYVDIGLFEFDPGVLRSVNRDLLTGLRVGSDLQRMANREAVIATPVDIFLNRRGRVSVFRDGRLIYAGFYEAGHQLLDTTRFPSGSYQIEIETPDNSGNAFRETRLFVKSSLLAPPEHPLWSVAIGTTGSRSNDQVFPEQLDPLQLRSSYRWRQADWLGLGLAAAASEVDALAEVSANIVRSVYSLGGEVYLGARGAWGWSLRANRRWSGGNLTISKQVRQAPAETLTASPRLVSDELRNVSLFLSQRVGSTLLTGSLSRGSVAGVSREARATLKASRSVRLLRSHRARMSASFSTVDGDPQLGFSIQWTGGLAGHRYGASHEQVHFTKDTQRSISSTSAYSRWDGAMADGARWGSNLSATQDEAGEQAAFDGEYFGERGQARVGVLHRSFGGKAATQYSLAHETSVVLGPKWQFGWGGTRPEEAAVLVHADGIGEGALDLVVDGRRETSTRPHEQVPLLLAPYREYVIGVRDRGRSILDFAEGDQRVVLYPGDVKILRWTVSRMNVLLARVYRERKQCLSDRAFCLSGLEPLRNAVVTGASEWTQTTDSGFLQAEVAEQVMSLQARTADGECTIDLSRQPARDGIVRSSLLICR